MVDTDARLQTDFFPDTLGALGRAAVADVVGVPLREVRAQDLPDHKLALLAEASVENPIDEKHYSDAKRLGAVCGRDMSLPVSHFARPSYATTSTKC